jgi:hypothetical protein
MIFQGFLILFLTCQSEQFKSIPTSRFPSSTQFKHLYINSGCPIQGTQLAGERPVDWWVKGEAIPLLAWTGLEGLRGSGFQNFYTLGT